MNIIIFSKRTARDANGKYGPHVRWNQEEVNPRRRERHLVSHSWHILVASWHEMTRTP